MVDVGLGGKPLPSACKAPVKPEVIIIAVGGVVHYLILIFNIT
jgi:hypothetical protein